MKKRIDQNVLRKLKHLCDQNGFTNRGDAYFRLIEGSVLQVIKYEYERTMDYFDLRFGLFSMYSELEKQWFTSHGCIPRYSVVNLKGRRSPVVLKKKKVL